MTATSVSMSYTPQQYVLRAHEAIRIGTAGETPKGRLAAQIAIAEATQIVFFAALTTLYALAYAGIIPPLVAGVASLILIPVGALASYNTFVHYKHVSRIFMTVAATTTLVACALLACYGKVGDSAITLCGGGVLVHTLRNLAEFIDARNALKDLEHRKRVFDPSPPPSPSTTRHSQS